MKKEDRKFEGIWIPKEIRISKQLTIMEKIFLVEINSLDNDDGCFASNGYFADFFGVSKGRCTQIIKSLESKGLVSIELQREGKNISKRVVRIINTLFNKLNTLPAKTKHPYLENDEDSNTVISNTDSTNTSVHALQETNAGSVLSINAGSDKKKTNHDFGFSDSLEESINNFIEYRRSKGKRHSMTDGAIKLLKGKLKKRNVSEKIVIEQIEEAIISGYMSVYEPKEWQIKKGQPDPLERYKDFRLKLDKLDESDTDGRIKLIEDAKEKQGEEFFIVAKKAYRDYQNSI